jgi:hypothetical protein
VPPRLVHRALVEAADHWSPEQWQALWRRLAPRALRSIAHYRGDMNTDWELRSLGYADFPAWPSDERVALENALGRVLEYALSYGDPTAQVTELLGGLACAYDDIGPWLARIDAMTGPEVDAGALRLVFAWSTELLWGEQRWFPWWWPEDPTSIVLSWLCSPAVRERVSRFADLHPDCKTAADIRIARAALDHDPTYSPWYRPGIGYDQMQKWGQPTSYGSLQPVPIRG